MDYSGIDYDGANGYEHTYNNNNNNDNAEDYVRAPIPTRRDRLLGPSTNIIDAIPKDNVDTTTLNQDSSSADQDKLVYIYWCTCGQLNVQLGEDIRLHYVNVNMNTYNSNSTNGLCVRCHKEPVCIQLPMCGCHNTCFMCYNKHSERIRVYPEELQILLNLCG
jgi:hypothetical protein